MGLRDRPCRTRPTQNAERRLLRTLRAGAGPEGRDRTTHRACSQLGYLGAMGMETQDVAKPIRFMTFNLRFDTILDAEAGNRWANRAKSVFETLRREGPDIVGFQEALNSQLADL